eukprot:COSAG04_NODE_1318_length_7243_cov_8.351204_5_plen_203_part_00
MLVVEAAQGESRRSPAVTAAPAAASPPRSRRQGSRLRALAGHLRGSPQRCGCRTHPPRLLPPMPAAAAAAGSELPPVSTQLSNAEISRRFEAQGFIHIPSLFSPSEMREMEAALEHFITCAQQHNLCCHSPELPSLSWCDGRSAVLTGTCCRRAPSADTTTTRRTLTRSSRSTRWRSCRISTPCTTALAASPRCVNAPTTDL